MKKILSLTLALLMSMVLAVPAFAETTPSAPPDASEENNDVMPSTVLFPTTAISGTSSYVEDDLTLYVYVTDDFTVSSSNGNYIQFWFQNTTSEEVAVLLCKTDSGKEIIVQDMVVDGNSQSQDVYNNSTATADSGTYHIKIVAIEKISGNLSVAQYTNPPAGNRSRKLDMDSGDLTNKAGLKTYYYLNRSNGIYTNLYVENKGTTSVVATINDQNARTFKPGESGHIYVEVTQDESSGLDRIYEYKVGTTGSGIGEINIHFEISQRDSQDS